MLLRKQARAARRLEGADKVATYMNDCLVSIPTRRMNDTARMGQAPGGTIQDARRASINTVYNAGMHPGDYMG